ncbi:hypothetical protein HELRODRAFT_67442 [Helobdella robusta]|uniref:Rab-GAP TBC domain-containing protein n=1 Tax=Helobdella robusta TaxID=6412 RepID=T1FZ09_HELRO|nr:hypothetical protein HELRODRAFT_67442 [Helobdella robusta]ESN99017.1 hypothetical protein HELRODRAFT_67442 [Helobdella robusta]
MFRESIFSSFHIVSFLIDRTLDAEEKILLAQSAKERAEIVDKYDRGGKGVDIDPWEDPTYEVYHVTDRYGFIHDKRLPEVMSTVEMKVAKQTEIERKQKWVKMCSKWDQSYGSDKFFKRLYKGLPEAIRGLVWSKILKLNDVKKENEGVYEDMKQKARRWCPDIRQIDLDVNRTYRNHIMFRKRYDVKQQSLFHVLAAYSMYNTEVGYCQGMSQIAAIMLMYMNEEDAFWAMSQLLTNDRHAMHGFFIPGFPKLIRFQDHHDKILKKFLPRVKKHLTRNDMYTPLYTIKWYMQCFLDRVPFPLAMRLWDIYIYEGERLLVAMSYNIIKMHKKRIMQLDMDHLMSFFQVGLVTDFGYHGDKVIESLIECAEDLRKAKMDLPPPSTDISLEKPTKPFGVFEIPDLDQVIIK